MGWTNCVAGVLLVASISFLSSCQKSVEPGKTTGNRIYATSFESDADTIGWWGYGSRTFRHDAPPGGGYRSLVVSGGCIVPHAGVDLPPLSSSMYISLRCWGKALHGGGSIVLDYGYETPRGISVYVSDTVWTEYSVTDSLLCLANLPLRLSFFSGGIVPGSMAVDLLEITGRP